MSRHLATSFRRADLAVDLGTAITRVASADGVLATPSEYGRARPLRGGVVVDRPLAARVLGPLLHRARGPGLGSPRVVACVPTGASGEERAAVVDVVRRAGASRVAVVAEPIAAAVGAGLDLSSPYALMIVDVGHGVTDAAIVRAGTIVLAAAERTACGDLEEAALRHIHDRHGVALSPWHAARLLRRLWFDPEARGMGCVPVPAPGEGAGGATIDIDLAPLAESLRPVHERIVGVIDDLVRRAPAGIGAELVESGIALTGGGSLVPGFADSLSRRTRLIVRVVADPLGAVVRGARRMLPMVDRFDLWE